MIKMGLIKKVTKTLCVLLAGLALNSVASAYEVKESVNELWGIPLSVESKPYTIYEPNIKKFCYFSNLYLFFSIINSNEDNPEVFLAYSVKTVWSSSFKYNIAGLISDHKEATNLIELEIKDNDNEPIKITGNWFRGKYKIDSIDVKGFNISF